jgi:hypothetical protein
LIISITDLRPLASTTYETNLCNPSDKGEDTEKLTRAVEASKANGATGFPSNVT